ncbi:MAG: PAS domain S-box protein [Thiotrichales bacterium]|jgi:methyl-accepting chemotaxis protein|nr:PAS domain S-box protein [Thiotrichales bacterium]
MRNNQPVTQKEYQLPAGALLVSYTDLQGNIIKANEAFVEASGYAWSELMGQPHNLLRHPDVPEQVFADLWATIEDDRPWSQIVKNRRKNGDHYWVLANTTPIRDDNGRITGYMSVRQPATREQIAGAEAAYRAISAGKAKLKHGQVDTIGNHINTLAHLNPQWTIIPTGIASLVAFLLHLSGVVIGVWGELFVTLLALLAAAHAMYFVSRIKESLTVVDALANGKFDTPVNTFGENIAGVLARRLSSMQVRLGSSINDNNEMLLKSKRLEQALGTLHANVMVADQNRTIIYVNPSVVALLSRLEKDIQTVLPHFQANNLVGKSIDIFHKNPQHQITMLDNLRDTYVAKIDIAGHPLQLVTNPIFDDNKKRIGTAVEWQDVFMEQKIQSELANTLSQNAKGHVEARIQTQGLTGFYESLAKQLNDMFAATEIALTNYGKVMHALAQNDLTERVNADFEGLRGRVNSDMNASLSTLARTFATISHNMSQITHNIDQLNVASQESSHRTQETAASLQETAAAVEQITTSIQRASESTRQATDFAHQVRASAGKGVIVVNESVTAMTEIEAHSRKIEEITSLIDSIAFQTNLLALNAAVEAARAGEHGRGFAVVASEVRALAGKSADAARDIKGLIEETVGKIRAGSGKVQSTAMVLKEIETQAAQVEQLVESIASTSGEQATTMNEIHRTIESIDEMTQQSAAQAGELAAMSDNMSQQASEVAQLLAQFRLPAGTVSAPPRAVTANKRPATGLPAPKTTPNPAAASLSNTEWEDF